MAKCIMVQGTMSGVGKSLLVTALCRIFREEGLRVAPFKSQNMALNSFITADGLEMSAAQAIQAQAAGIQPDVRMNPILLKPVSDMGSELIVNGCSQGRWKAARYFAMKQDLVPEVRQAYDSLAEEYDLIVIEGAGSPAEINLPEDPFVNMGLARLLEAPVLLVGDIDRGGVFAQICGTVMLLGEDRSRVKGLIINKFRGDPSLLGPGLEQLEDLTHVPVLGIVPHMDVDIEDEDSLSPRLERREHTALLDIAVIRFPHIRNFTDFAPLERHPLLGVRFVAHLQDLGQPDLVILPQSANPQDDAVWLEQSGMRAAMRERAPVLEFAPGMFDSGSQTKILADRLLAAKGLPRVESELLTRREYQEEQIGILAAGVRAGLDISRICRIIEEAWHD